MVRPRFAGLAVMLAVAGLAALVAPSRAAYPCAVTSPNGERFPVGGFSFPEGSPPPDWKPPSHGNGLIFVNFLPLDGVLDFKEEFVRSDGSVSTKLPWAIRAEIYVPGGFTVEGTRLDASGPPLTASYAEQGTFYPGGVRFPTPGCWEVTGSIADHSLSVVMLVLIEGQPLPDTAAAAGESARTAGIALLSMAVLLSVATLFRTHRRSNRSERSAL
jgi:hypothetical protein